MVFVASGIELVGGEICEEEGEGLRTLPAIESEHKGASSGVGVGGCDGWSKESCVIGTVMWGG